MHNTSWSSHIPLHNTSQYLFYNYAIRKPIHCHIKSTKDPKLKNNNKKNKYKISEREMEWEYSQGQDSYLQYWGDSPSSPLLSAEKSLIALHLLQLLSTFLSRLYSTCEHFSTNLSWFVCRYSVNVSPNFIPINFVTD